ncbi:uncharacterized protein LOC131941276 [Physella acuta]|uniref:uncharacterized protein LOC131941276 n=1 Tax=Physella acuta TaxID=109671 RepID=UPI0027DDA669|nr:uncharacterized protein LOC131941276 [Physella acuta]XP_059156424.1 uncharacterized protein LOC131941276 [Physella acuta]XP_059156425.1 uncharacterized protein LOC131941276 [Physella acuta]XP_059156426.1 uncharacterized protein LOC131941276 [Physella acuta]XP_059156427.1 uncharacterized protein LOC131941276 [Physella acuta]
MRKKKTCCPALLFVSSPSEQPVPVVPPDGVGDKPMSVKAISIGEVCQPLWVSPQFSGEGGLGEILTSSHENKSRNEGLKNWRFKPLKFLTLAPRGLIHPTQTQQTTGVAGQWLDIATPSLWCANTSHGDTPPNTSHGETPPNTSHGETPPNTSHGETPTNTSHGETPPNTSPGEITPTKSSGLPKILVADTPELDYGLKMRERQLKYKDGS